MLVFKHLRVMVIDKQQLKLNSEGITLHQGFGSDDETSWYLSSVYNCWDP